MRLTLIIVLLLMHLSPAASAQKCNDKRLALTFDDAPTIDTGIFTGEQRTQRIISALQQAGVRQAGFFAVSERLDEAGDRRLSAYAAAGHVIANHTHSHINLHRVSTQAFLQDVKKAHRALSKYPTFMPLFRFPYLNEGISAQQRDQIRIGLNNLGYRQGYVTIDNFDFYLDRLLREATAAGLGIDHSKLSQLYAEVIVGAAEHYHNMACRWLDRTPAHVLLLHENDIAALYLNSLVTALKASGWSIIPVTDAYQDPIAKFMPDTLLLGQGRVAALAHLAGAAAESLRHQGENTDYLQQRFASIITESDTPH